MRRSEISEDKLLLSDETAPAQVSSRINFMLEKHGQIPFASVCVFIILSISKSLESLDGENITAG